MQIPVVSGIYADTSPDFRTSYPRNMVPVPKVTGLSQGYLRIADGIEQVGTGPGVMRGGIVWNDVYYAVMGTKFGRISAAGVFTEIGDVGAGGTCSITYGFDYLAVASGGRLYLYDGTTLAQNTDVDLGTVVDVVWVAGYFMTTDGEFLVVTELNDPFSVNPLKYGSSEEDPDPVVAVVNLRNEIYAVNRNTIEIFSNTGGEGFPFSKVSGGQSRRGAFGPHCVTIYMDSVAFLGSGRNEPPGVYMAANGGAQKISTREIDVILAGYSEADLAEAVVETRMDYGNDTLIIHLPQHTLCFDGAAAQVIGHPVWYSLSSSVDGSQAFDGRHIIWAHDKWFVGSNTSAKIGTLSKEVHSHWGAIVTWEFGLPIIYNEGRGAQIHELEMVCLTGAAALGSDPSVSTSYSLDGVSWSQEKYRKAGKQGDRVHRVRWMRQGAVRNWRVQRFTGSSDAPLSVARVEARIEALAW